jgi:hypothetical protein
VCVPVVLDLVVGPTRQACGNCGPLVAENTVELDDDLLLFESETASLDVRSEVVGPPETAALPTPLETSILGEGAPVAITVLVNVIDEFMILLGGPRTFLQPILVTTRSSSHTDLCFSFE